MFTEMVYVLIGTNIFVYGYKLRNGPWWHLLLSIFIAIIGINMIFMAGQRYERRRTMPFIWRCPICMNKGREIGCTASTEALVDSFRNNHNRTVHLMEP